MGELPRACIEVASVQYVGKWGTLEKSKHIESITDTSILHRFKNRKESIETCHRVSSGIDCID